MCGVSITRGASSGREGAGHAANVRAAKAAGLGLSCGGPPPPPSSWLPEPPPPQRLAGPAQDRHPQPPAPGHSKGTRRRSKGGETVRRRGCCCCRRLVLLASGAAATSAADLTPSAGTPRQCWVTCGPRNMPKGTPPYFSVWCSCTGGGGGGGDAGTWAGGRVRRLRSVLHRRHARVDVQAWHAGMQAWRRVVRAMPAASPTWWASTMRFMAGSSAMGPTGKRLCTRPSCTNLHERGSRGRPRAHRFSKGRRDASTRAPAQRGRRQHGTRAGAADPAPAPHTLPANKAPPHRAAAAAAAAAAGPRLGLTCRRCRRA